MTPIRTKSDKPFDNAVNRIRQSGKRDDAFAERFSRALAGRDRAWLARETGLSASTLHDYSKGAIPSADRAFLLADMLEVDPRWLVTGEGQPTPLACEDEELVQLPCRSLPEGTVVEWAPFSRKWLLRAFGRAEGLWVTDMPSQALPEIAREGDPILCMDADRLVEGGLYLVALGMGVAVRQLTSIESGHTLVSGGELSEPSGRSFRDAKAEGRLLGRIVGTPVKRL